MTDRSEPNLGYREEPAVDHRAALREEIEGIPREDGEIDTYALRKKLRDARATRQPLWDLLLAVDGIGPVRARRKLEQAGLGGYISARHLTDAQIDRLLEVL